jgi:hypothetical protein
MQPLPFRPQAIYISMQQEEQGIFRGEVDNLEKATKVAMRFPVGVPLHFTDEVRIQIIVSSEGHRL